MFFGLFRRKASAPTDATYAAIVAQARQPVFYLGYDVADTVAGRFDMILAHMVVYCARFSAEDKPARDAMQAVLDRFFLDMDHSLREQGVSDIGVPKKMKGLAAAYLGRSDAYGPALADGDAAALAAALSRNVFGEKEPGLGAGALAHYMIAARDALATADIADLVAGRIPWPDAAAFDPAPETTSAELPSQKETSP